MHCPCNVCIYADLLIWSSPYLVAGLCASGLHSGQTIIISGNGVVMFDALLGAALFVDFHQWQRRRVVLHQPHLRRHCHHSGHWRDGERERGKKTEYRWERDGEGRAQGINKMQRSPREKRRGESGSREGGKERGKQPSQWHTNCKHLAALVSKHSVLPQREKTDLNLQLK